MKTVVAGFYIHARYQIAKIAVEWFLRDQNDHRTFSHRSHRMDSIWNTALSLKTFLVKI